MNRQVVPSKYGLHYSGIQDHGLEEFSMDSFEKSLRTKKFEPIDKCEAVSCIEKWAI
jgi:hypothetical protein